MLDIGWSEMLVIAVVAIVIIGPKDLPRALRVFGQWMGKARAMAREFQNSLDDIAREAELDEIKKQVEDVSAFDIKGEIEKSFDPTGGDALGPEAQPLPAAGGDTAVTEAPAPEPAAETPAEAPEPEPEPAAAPEAPAEAPEPEREPAAAPETQAPEPEPAAPPETQAPADAPVKSGAHG